MTRCDEMCMSQAWAQMLGPLRPNATICAHGVRREKADLCAPADDPHLSGAGSVTDNQCPTCYAQTHHVGPGWMSVCGQVSNTVATDDLAAVTCDICRGSVTDNREAEDYSGCSYLLHPGPPDRVHLIVCERCGALVHDKDVHDEFHRGRVL